MVSKRCFTLLISIYGTGSSFTCYWKGNAIINIPDTKSVTYSSDLPARYIGESAQVLLLESTTFMLDLRFHEREPISDTANVVKSLIAYRS